jgi:hypothetical protein
MLSMRPKTLNQSRQYLATLHTTGREELVKQLKERAPGIRVTGTHLYLIGVGKRSPSRKLSILLEEVTRGKVAAIDFNREVMDEIRK